MWCKMASQQRCDPGDLVANRLERGPIVSATQSNRVKQIFVGGAVLTALSIASGACSLEHGPCSGGAAPRRTDSHTLVSEAATKLPAPPKPKPRINDGEGFSDASAWLEWVRSQPPVSEADAKVLTSAKLSDLSASLDAVRSEFNAHKQEARFLTLLSPMCPACQSGARGVRKSVLDNPATKSLATMVVWIPILDADGLPAAVVASASYRNFPVPQFWDGNQRLGKEVARSIDAPDWTAWDIYYFYPPGAEWGDKGIPKPEVGLVQDLPNGVVVGFKGTLPPAADQSRLRDGLRGRADVVGELSNFETLLAQVAEPFAKRYARR